MLFGKFYLPLPTKKKDMSSKECIARMSKVLFWDMDIDEEVSCSHYPISAPYRIQNPKNTDAITSDSPSRHFGTPKAFSSFLPSATKSLSITVLTI